MMRRVFIAYQVELAKALRYKPTYAGPFLVIVAVLLTTLQRPPVADGRSDYAFIGLATAQALNVVGLLAVLVYVGTLISAEVQNGSIRGMLTRPLPRHEYVLAKLLHAITYVAVLTAVCGVCSWIVVLAMGEMNGVSYGGDLLHSGNSMITAYLGGALWALVPLSTVAAYALCVSALFRRPLVAAGLAVGGWLVLEFIKYPLGIDFAFFSAYIESPWAVFIARAEGLPASWVHELRNCLFTSVPALVLFTAGAVLAMRNRNLG